MSDDKVSRRKKFDRSKFMSERNRRMWKDPKYRKEQTERLRLRSLRMWKTKKRQMSKVVGKNGGSYLSWAWENDPEFRAKHKKSCTTPQFRELSKERILHLYKTSLEFRKSQARAGRKTMLWLWRQKWFRELVSKVVSEANKRHRKKKAEEFSKRTRALWKNPSYRKRMEKILAKNRKQVGYGPSKIQLKIFEKLISLGVRGLRLEWPVLTYRLDIANPRKKVAVEVDGPYYHKNTKKDRMRDNKLRCLGWRIYRLSLKKHLTESLLEEVARFLS